ncbi:unnamed protein product [Diatraea saccharalis]|uniref:Uncharacterized protein n=1 Tax=Diatraea saccharalis TaxID=40085 RepID=A0A9N9N4T8_9NEOP|nr:unnamed protein product [Diatraea saccharalis]
MALTEAEKMRRRREKLKKLKQYDDFKAKHRQQAQKSSAKAKIELNKLPKTKLNKKLEEIRRKTRERVQRHRNKKKELLDDNQLESTSYSNPKTLGKAKSRVKKALPACPLRKKAVLQKILEEIDIEPSTSTQKSKHCISDEILAKVKQFYERDDISRQAPGLKDVKTVREVQSGDLDELQKHLIDLTPSFKVHSFVKNSQAKAYEKDKEAVTKNKNEVTSLLQIDFSENYTCLAQDEVQSFHWVQPQVGNKYSSVKVINVNEEEIERRFANLKLKDVFDAAVHVEGIAKIHNIYTSNCVVKTVSVTIDSNLIKEKSFYHTVYGSDESDSSDDDVPLSIIRKKC